MGSVTYFAEMGQIDNRAVLTSGGDGSGGWELRNRFVSAKFDSETGALLAIDNTTVAAKFEVYNTSHIPGNHMSNRYFSVFNSSLPEAPFVSGSRKPRAWRIDGYSLLFSFFFFADICYAVRCSRKWCLRLTPI
jgi:hypothetical protein